MAGVFILLALLSTVGLLWGLMYPEHLSKATKLQRPMSRTHFGLGFGFLIVLCLILVGISTPAQPKTIHTTLTSSKTQISAPKPTVTTKTVTSTSSIAFTTNTEDDSSLAEGQTRIAQSGQNGVQTSTYLITYTNGVQTNRQLESQSVTTQPVQEIIEDGTYVVPATTPSPAPTPPCHPLSDEDTCYEAGEYCRDADEGVTGVAGDGESIICENNDGLRWEPV